MDALENLVAQQEIRDLSARYAMSLDDHDSDALAQLWTEGNAVWLRSSASATIIFASAARSYRHGLRLSRLPHRVDYFAKHINGQSLIEVEHEDGMQPPTARLSIP